MRKTITQKNNTKNFSLIQEDWSSAFQNVHKELQKLPLKLIKGEKIKSLKGTLYRNGPGQLERGGQWVHHPFDGDGMISAIAFNNGEANFSNRFVRTKGWLEENKSGRFCYRGVFGTKKPGGVISNALDLRLKNIANTHVIKLGNNLLALWEAAGPHALNPNNLETIGPTTLNGVLKKNEPFSAHPKIDPGHHNSKTLVTFGVTAGPTSRIRLMEFSEDGELLADKQETFKGFAFLHDFAITPNWAIFLQNSIDFNPVPFVLGSKSAAQCLSSSSTKNGKFWLIPRENGRFRGESPKIFDAPSGFVFHHVNAFETNNEIIIDSIFYQDFPSIGPEEDFRKINFEEYPEGKLKRSTINILNGSINLECLSPQCCEFAMVNPSKLGSKPKYCWMASTNKKTGNDPLQSIKKLNLENGMSTYWSAGPRSFVNEPIMIPVSSSSPEDEGFVLTYVWNGEKKRTNLVILDAKDLTEKAIYELPIAIPHGLHGSWVEN